MAASEKLAATTTALAAANAAVLLSNQALPIHASVFESHRIKSMKNLFSNLLHSEIRYHCRAIEELSAVLESIANIETEETIIGSPSESEAKDKESVGAIL